MSYIHPCDQAGSVADPTYVREADEARQELNELLGRKSREVVEYADEHESGQLRIAVAGEQVPLLPLPDELIPTTEETEA